MPTDKPFLHLVVESPMLAALDKRWHALEMRSRSDTARGLMAWALERQPTRAEVDAALEKYRAS